MNQLQQKVGVSTGNPCANVSMHVHLLQPVFRQCPFWTSLMALSLRPSPKSILEILAMTQVAPFLTIPLLTYQWRQSLLAYLYKLLQY